MAARQEKRKQKVPHLKHFLIPGPHNVYRPLFLQIESFVATVIAILVLLGLAIAVEKLVVQNPSSQLGAVVSSVLVQLANVDRAKEGLPELAVNTTLQEAAQKKADDMAAKEYFAHETPDGKTPWYWFKNAGYDFRYAGENLAVYFSDSTEVERAWMNSPLHRANILSNRYTEIGVALAHGSYEGHETTFVVQMFGKPSEASGNGGETTIVSKTPSVKAPVGGAEAETKPVGALKSGPSTFLRILTSPKTTLQYLYMGIGLLILIAIGLLFVVELRRLHVPSLFRGVSLLALMGGLLYGGAVLSGTLQIL